MIWAAINSAIRGTFKTGSKIDLEGVEVVDTDQGSDESIWLIVVLLVLLGGSVVYLTKANK